MNSVISKTSERAALQWLAAVCLFTATLAFSQTTTAQQSEPSREPILRIETGMHAAAIRRIGVDAANRFLVTASEDKTVRLLELATGRLLRVIRPPIGDGSEGMLFAIAISPDSQIIATGGFTAVEQGKTSIYLFDRESGKLVIEDFRGFRMASVT